MSRKAEQQKKRYQKEVKYSVDIYKDQYSGKPFINKSRYCADESLGEFTVDHQFLEPELLPELQTVNNIIQNILEIYGYLDEYGLKYTIIGRFIHIIFWQAAADIAHWKEAKKWCYTKIVEENVNASIIKFLERNTSAYLLKYVYLWDIISSILNEADNRIWRRIGKSNKLLTSTRAQRWGSAIAKEIIDYLTPKIEEEQKDNKKAKEIPIYMTNDRIKVKRFIYNINKCINKKNKKMYK